MQQTTKQRELHPRGWLAGLCGLAMVVGLVPTGVSQQAAPGQPTVSRPAVIAPAKPAASAVKPTGEEEEEAATPRKKGGEGIKMHGHWVLQVKNVDGTLGERREFDNSLVVGTQADIATGDQALAAILTGLATPGDWLIGLISGTTTTPNIDTSAFCFSGHFPAPSPPPGINCYTMVGTTGVKLWNDIAYPQAGLQVSATFSPTVSINLTDNFTVPSGLGTLGQINAVQSMLVMCVADYPGGTGGDRFSGTFPAYQSAYTPQNCENQQNISGTLLDISPVTSTNITSNGVLSPLPVISGQIIFVTVTLSFS